jgi:hypothetical protein
MKTTEEILQETAAIELEIKRVNLDLLKEQLETLNGKKESRRLIMQRQDRDLKKNEELKQRRESNCKHKKGGRNKAGIDKGNSPNYAIIHNTYPAGEVEMMCQRCGKEWKMPPIELKAENPAAYLSALKEYNTVRFDWPTDNEPSGTQLFLITRTDTPTGRAPRTTEGETAVRAPRSRSKKKAAA